MSNRFDPLHEVDRMMTSMLRGGAPSAMPMDLYRRGDEFVAEIDLPGIDPETIDIDVEDRTLTVRAARQSRAQEVRWLSRERVHGTFARQISLGHGLAFDKITADYAEGVLTIVIPVAEQAKPRKVSVARSGRSREIATHVESGTTTAATQPGQLGGYAASGAAVVGAETRHDTVSGNVVPPAHPGPESTDVPGRAETASPYTAAPAANPGPSSESYQAGVTGSDTHDGGEVHHEVLAPTGDEDLLAPRDLHHDEIPPTGEEDLAHLQGMPPQRDTDLGGMKSPGEPPSESWREHAEQTLRQHSGATEPGKLDGQFAGEGEQPGEPQVRTGWQRPTGWPSPRSGLWGRSDEQRTEDQRPEDQH